MEFGTLLQPVWEFKSLELHLQTIKQVFGQLILVDVCFDIKGIMDQ